MDNKKTFWPSLDIDSLQQAVLEPAYRRPSQDRGKDKFERILDAAHRLIEERGFNQFSLTDVAKEARVANGSAYHFFPNIEAMFVALVERYDETFVNVISAPIDANQVSGWRNILEIHFERARNYINANPPVLILLIGPGRSWQTKQADTVSDISIAKAMAESIGQHYTLPDFPPPDELLHFGIRILEGLWELSVQQHGHITAEFSQQTIRAVYAYLRSYWPEYLPLKS